MAIIILICFIISVSGGGMLNAAAPLGSYHPERQSTGQCLQRPLIAFGHAWLLALGR